jgi:hypothetical protein
MVMIRHSILFPYVISKFNAHKELKNELLNLIQNDGRSIKNDRDIIENTDYDYGNFVEKKYFQRLLQPLVEHMIDVVQSLQINDFKIDSCWFQQYTTNDTHSWHRHPNTQYANVYYLELPKNGPPTELKNPYDNEIIRPEVYEGCILTFPAMVMHRSPPNKSNQQKTVIAFNLSEVGLSV